ncbi:unnamed protein product [Caenorhabditis sp. 36 PRJEB53466]|nr:unnamed protein product [Caenorhabditis sp. 36 PRJEB53466]
MSNGYGVQAASETTISDSSADASTFAKPIGQVAGADFTKQSSCELFSSLLCQLFKLCKQPTALQIHSINVHSKRSSVLNRNPSFSVPFLSTVSNLIDKFKKYPVSVLDRRRLSPRMTYAESTRSAVVYSSIVPPPRTPVGPSMLKDGVRKGSASASALPLQPKNGTNSLDFWSKSEDEKSGITCYYSRHNIQFPSQRQINRMKQTPGRPTMTGFPTTSTAPSSPQQNGNGNGGAIRYPPFPQTQPEAVMSPPVGIYRNVPAMPRAKLAKEEKNGKSRTGEENGPPKNVVWGGNSGRRGGDDDGGAATSATMPLNPYNGNASCEKKRSTARRKPRWARCMQTLFCCVTPPREIEKIQSNQRTSSTTTTNNIQNGRSSTPTNNGPPIQLITQVHRDGTVTGLPTVPQNGSGDGPTPYEKIANESVSINEKPLLPPLLPQDTNKKCLVIDLDETLVHSSFKPVKNPDFVIPVEIDGVEHQAYVLKRPYVDEFLAKVGEHFECVLFTASLAKYADPVADLLDKKKVFRSRLFREACVFHKGNYVKDLSRLGRNLSQTLIIDNSPASYAFHPENAVPVTTWFDNPADTELMDILPTLDHLNGFSSIYDLYRPEEGPQSELLNHCSC